LLYLIAIVANDGDNLLGANSADRRQRMAEHRSATDFMKYLCAARFHSRAGASCENNRGDLFAHMTPSSVPLALPG